MEKRSLIPVRNFFNTGNQLIDVLLADGQLFVRIIDYRLDYKDELWHTCLEEIKKERHGKTALKHIESAFNYCRELTQTLSLDSLSKKARQLLEDLDTVDQEEFTINKLNNYTELTKGEIIDASDELWNKGLVKMKANTYITKVDRFAHLRPYFKEAENQHFLK